MVDGKLRKNYTTVAGGLGKILAQRIPTSGSTANGPVKL